MTILDRFRKKAEMELTAELVRELLRDQQPDLADRPLTLGARGWANQMWRLGDDLAVRLRWQTRTADALLKDDATWRRARGWAVWRAAGSLSSATAGPRGGKPSWGPPALASLQRPTESVAPRSTP